jgi:uncharacterized protein
MAECLLPKENVGGSIPLSRSKKLNMINRPLKEQSEKLLEIILVNPIVNKILDSSPFPGYISWYLGAGCICQSVWNYLSGRPIDENINDYDLAYYDAKDLSKETETNEQTRVDELCSLPVKLEVVNQARCHLWYEEDFGKKIEQFKSCEDAINRWPTTSTTVAVNKIGENYNIYAPYGLNDLFGLIIRPNKPSVFKESYEKKVEKWTRKWPMLKVVPWEQV